MNINLYETVKWLVCMLYTAIIYLGGMALILLSLLLYHNKNMQCTNLEFWIIVIGGGIIAIIVDYLAGKFNIIGK